MEDQRLGNTTIRKQRFVANMEMVLDVYKIPYNKAIPILGMDESPKQLIKETRTPIARKSGSDAKEDFGYERCGVTDIFMVTVLPKF